MAMEKAARVCLLDMRDEDLHMERASLMCPDTESPGPTSVSASARGPKEYSRSQKKKSLKNQFALGYEDDPERFSTDAEKMLHAQRDQRMAAILRRDEEKRAKKHWQEFRRLEERDKEFLDQLARDSAVRENCGGASQSNRSSTNYNIVTREFGPGYEGDVMRYKDSLIEWRKSMRALWLQSKSSRNYNVLSWERSQPCCPAPPKPEAPLLPDPDAEALKTPAVRKQSPPRPRNMLYSMYKLDDVPVAPSSTASPAAAQAKSL